MLKRSRVPYVEQVQTTECGLCCVAMLLKFYGSHYKLNELREYFDVGRDGTSFLQLKKLLETLNFDTKALKCKLEFLPNVELPAIILWENNHFVILESISKKKAVIVDPNFGRRSMQISEFKSSYSNCILLAHPNENYKKKKRGKSVWNDFFPLIKKNNSLLLKILVLSLISYIISLCQPIFIQIIIDKVTKNKILPYNNLIMFCVILLIGNMVTLGRSKKLTNVRVSMDKDINEHLFMHLLKVPYHFFDVRSKGNILFTVNSASIVRDVFAEKVINCVLDVGSVLFIIIYMFYKSKALAITAGILFILNIIVIVISKPYLEEYNNYQLAEQSNLQSTQVEAIYSILGIKMTGVENFVFENWKLKYNRYINRFFEKENFNNVLEFIFNIIRDFSPIIILIYGLYLITLNEVTIGESVALYTLSGSLFSSANSISFNWNSIITAGLYTERISEVLSTEEEKSGSNKIEFNGSIDLENVSFSYSNTSENVLNDISLNIEEGSCVAIVGTSGSGKSTLAKIIAGLYQPSSGNIYYDGYNLNKLDSKHLRKQIGIVPQDITLFNKSIRENIAMSNSDMSLDKIKYAAQIANIDEEIEKMPMKYETIISEMGINLSGGQRQRIALAKAIINNPKVILLDEATSSLDMVNESKISQYFNSIGCTRIIIAHRLSTIKDADLIIVLDDGKIVESGTHNDLINKKEKYYELYNTSNSK